MFPRKMEVKKAARALKVAIVYSRTPLPMNRADQLTVAHFISFLAERGHVVDLFTIENGGQRQERHTKWLSEHCRNVFLFDLNVWEVLWNILCIPFSRLPFQVALFTNSKQRQKLEEMAEKEQYDAIYTYYLRSAEVSKNIVLKKGKKVIGLQLSQSLNTERIWKKAHNRTLKWFYWLENRLLSDYETRVWQAFDASILIGEKDYEAFKDIAVALERPVINNHHFIAHGTDTSRFKKRNDIPEVPDLLVFSGVMKTPTNIQAILWFIANVWPIIRQRRPQATIEIVGREPSDAVRKLHNRDGIIVTGTVEDPAMHIAKASVCINPMQAGGGMQNKLIEYMASEKAIVATTVANEGIKGVDGAHLLIRDSAEAFAEAVVELLENPVTRAKLGRQAARFVHENWTWEHHFEELESVLS